MVGGCGLRERQALAVSLNLKVAQDVEPDSGRSLVVVGHGANQRLLRNQGEIRGDFRAKSGFALRGRGLMEICPISLMIHAATTPFAELKPSQLSPTFGGGQMVSTRCCGPIRHRPTPS